MHVSTSIMVEQGSIYYDSMFTSSFSMQALEEKLSLIFGQERGFAVVPLIELSDSLILIQNKQAL